MNNKKIFTLLFLIGLLLLSPAYADYDYADSDEFQLDLLSLSLGSNYDYCDSGSFDLDLYPVNRGYSDSSEFEFNFLANCGPLIGDYFLALLPDENKLLQLNSSGNWVEPYNTPSPWTTIIVINHGWNDGPWDYDEKPGMLSLARAIASRVPDAYIYSWHWGDGPDVVSQANPNGQDSLADFAPLINLLNAGKKPLQAILAIKAVHDEISKSYTNAQENGWLLGETLMNMGIYSDTHKIHMIGHSFGGVVCANAAKKIYTESSYTPIEQLTTIDTPAIPGFNAISCVYPPSVKRVEALYYDCKEKLALGGTGGPVAGNYGNVLNLSLNDLHYLGVPVSGLLHSKAVAWYLESADEDTFNCENEPYGFGWSFSLFDPYNAQWYEGLPIGNLFETILSKGCTTTVGEVIVQEVAKTAVAAREQFVSAATWVGKKAEIVMDNTSIAVNTAIRLNVIPIIVAAGDVSAQTADGNDPNVAYIYKDIEIPPQAERVVFDFRFVTFNPGDTLTLSIAGDALVVIDADVVGTSENYQNSFPAFIGDYAGQTVRLQIALRCCGDQPSEVMIDNITFDYLTIEGDIDGDRSVDCNDLSIMSEQWLAQPGEPSADIAPDGGDNFINFIDFRLLSENWLQSIESSE